MSPWTILTDLISIHGCAALLWVAVEHGVRAWREGEP